MWDFLLLDKVVYLFDLYNIMEHKENIMVVERDCNIAH